MPDPIARDTETLAEVHLTDAEVEVGARALFEHFHKDRSKYGGVYEWPAPEQHLPWWRDAARAVLAARIEQARAGETALRERVEAAVRLVFERARENADEIEGARLALPDGGCVWVHTAGAIDEWLVARLAYELDDLRAALDTTGGPS